MSNDNHSYEEIQMKVILESALKKIIASITLKETKIRRLFFLTEIENRSKYTKKMEEIDNLVALFRGYIHINEHKRALKILVLLNLAVKQLNVMLEWEEI